MNALSYPKERHTSKTFSLDDRPSLEVIPLRFTPNALHILDISYKRETNVGSALQKYLTEMWYLDM